MKKIKTITLDQAIARANDFFSWDAKARGRDIYAKKYLYNLICRGVLKRYGPPHIAEIDADEFDLWLESRKAA